MKTAYAGKCLKIPAAPARRGVDIIGQRRNTCTWCPLRTWEWNILPEPSLVRFRNTKEVGLRGNDSRLYTISISPTQRDPSPQKPHQVYKYDWIHPDFNDHTSLRLSLASADYHIYAHADIYNQRGEIRRGAKIWGTVLSDGRERDQDKFTR